MKERGVKEWREGKKNHGGTENIGYVKQDGDENKIKICVTRTVVLEIKKKKSIGFKSRTLLHE